MEERKMSKYRSNFLSNVILKVEFSPILGLDKNNPPARFQSDIKVEFPILKTISGKQVEFKVDKDEPATISENEIVKWHFFDKEKTKIIEIAPNWVTIEYFKYKDFGDFAECFKRVLGMFFDIYDVVRILNRIGLRYINRIKIGQGNPFEWENLINTDIALVDRAFIDKKQDIKKSMHLLELKGDGYDLKCQFGMFNSEYPNTIAKKEFILDYDCYSNEELDKGEISSKAFAFHKVINSWFEKSIGDKLREIMEKVEDG